MEIEGHVLLVLDNEVELERLSRALTVAGYVVSLARSATQVMQALDQDIDAVVTGVEMGSLDGFAISRMMKCDRRTAALPFVFLTAGEAEAIRALLVEGADVAPRPANAEIVVLRLGKLLRTCRAESAHQKRRLAGLSSLACGLAHELGDPLAVALSELALAAAQRGHELARDQALSNAVESLRRVSGIVERMSRLGEAMISASS